MFKTLDPNGKYCAYKRKSRVDIEAEARGEEDTYAKHDRILFDTARRLGITIAKMYAEKPATSGERISERPEMINLLEDVESEGWDGVLTVEVERLARGDTMDQGIVAQAFKYSDTLIITPQRTYDPTNPDDEDYFEFGLFMSRREFKTINRRQQAGRVGSVQQGKYVGNKPPYGYNRVKLPGKGFSLEPHPEQAPIVQLIFSLYTHPDPEKRLGTSRLARHLNADLGVPTARNSKWTVATLNGIIRNPVYIGNVRWGSRPQIRRKNGKTRPRKARDQWIEVKGLHPPIIDEVTFKRAQDMLLKHGHAPVPAGKISNPLAGLIRCDMCGGAMVRRPYGGKKTPDTLICSTQDCPNVSSYLHLVEDRLLDSLKGWIIAYKKQWSKRKPKSPQNGQLMLKTHEDMLKSLIKREQDLNGQMDELHNLLEKKIYTTEVFLERSQLLAERIRETKASIERAEQEIQTEKKRNVAKLEIAPRVENVLEVYRKTESPAKKNALLKSILDHATYRKEKGGRWSGAIDQFVLEIHPILDIHH